ncbi:MAG: flavin reductase family protein [Elusimicrobiaceae bacterium]|nr:flavin reductase family protein [Elusimicrobiaceae bacterium]
MKEIQFDEHAKEVLQILRKGAFLTTHADGKTNTMTIGWGYLGIAWGKPVFGVMVRHNRYTHQLLDKNAQFTVTLPQEDLSKELAFCGTKSGLETDKIKACGFSLVPGKTVDVPLIACRGFQYECKVLCKTEMQRPLLEDAVREKWYEKVPNDYHTFYFGEITACYLED